MSFHYLYVDFPEINQRINIYMKSVSTYHWTTYLLYVSWPSGTGYRFENIIASIDCDLMTVAPLTVYKSYAYVT